MMVSSQDDNGPEAYIRRPPTPLDAMPTRARVYLDSLVVFQVAGHREIVAATFRIWSKSKERKGQCNATSIVVLNQYHRNKLPNIFRTSQLIRNRKTKGLLLSYNNSPLTIHLFSRLTETTVFFPPMS